MKAKVIITDTKGETGLFKVGDVCELKNSELKHPEGISYYTPVGNQVVGLTWSVTFRPTLTCDQCGTVVEDSDDIHNEYGVYRCTGCL